MYYGIIGYGWTSDFALEVLRMSEAQTNAYMAKLGQLTLGKIIALWATFGHEECQHGPFHIFGTLLNRLNEGQALGILTVSGIEIGAILGLALVCEHVLAKRPYLGDSEDGGC